MTPPTLSMSDIHALVGSGEIGLDELAAMMPHLERADVVEQYDAVMASTPTPLGTMQGGK